MAIREELSLDLSRALAQLDDLERQLDGLLQPIEIPVRVETNQALDDLRRDIAQVDNEQVNIDVETTNVDRAEAAFQELRQELGLVDNELETVSSQAKRTGDDLQRSGRGGSTAFSAATRGIALLTAAFGALQGARGLFQFFSDSIEQASNFEESLSKTRVVFGEFADDIEDFATTAPQALGLSNAAALEFAGTFGNLFVALGLTQQAAADLSPEIVQLGADLASFNNIPVEDALEKLRAGLVGEAEPLRALGVNLTAATVGAKALELGLASSTGEVSEAAKVQARYALILEQTATAQGDFARTSDGIANRQRTLTAEFDNLRQRVGEALLPAFEALVDLGPSIIQLIDAMTPSARNAAESFAEFTDNVEGFLLKTTQIIQITGALGDSFTLARTPILQTGEALAKLFTGDFGGAIGEIGELGDVLAELQDRAQIRGITIGIAEALLDGADSVEVFEAALEGAVRQTELTEEAFDQLATTAGVSDLEILRAAEATLALGAAAKLSAEEIQFLRNKITDLRNAQRGGDIEALRFQNMDDQAASFTAAADAAADAALTEAQALDILADAADQAGVSLLDLLTGAEPIPEEFRAIAGAVSQASIDFLTSVERFDEIKAEIGTLPGAMEAARIALKGEEDEIVDDFESFFDNLLEELEAREAFESNLAILRALGLDNLAQVFDEAGQEAAGVLADAVANPAEAARAESELRGFGEAQGAAYVGGVEEAIEGMPVTQGLIDNLIDAAGAADSPEVRAALLALINRLQTTLKLTIPVAFGAPDYSAITAARIPELGGGVGAGGSVTVNNTFVTEPNPTTDTQRITQVVGGIVGGNQPR